MSATSAPVICPNCRETDIPMEPMIGLGFQPRNARNSGLIPIHGYDCRACGTELICLVEHTSPRAATRCTSISGRHQIKHNGWHQIHRGQNSRAVQRRRDNRCNCRTDG